MDNSMNDGLTDAVRRFQWFSLPMVLYAPRQGAT
jgi:hypothetical protein